MTYWIIDNISWIGPSIIAAITTLWSYFTTRTNRRLETALKAIEVQLQKAQVDQAHLEINDKVNAAIEAALDRALNTHEAELNRLTKRYEVQIGQLKTDMEKAQVLKQQALELASTYEELINKLQKYNVYLKAVLDANNIKYKEEDEI